VDLSVVIVNWNSGEYVRRLLNSLQLVKKDLDKIIVIDNASKDTGITSLVEDEKLDLHRSKENLGFAAAANLGIGKASSAFVLLVNPDVQLTAEAVESLYRETSSETRAGISCCALIDEEGNSQSEFQFRPIPTLRTLLFDVLFIDELIGVVKKLLYSKGEGKAEMQRGPVELESQPAAALWLLRKEAWTDIGGFDERFYPAWFEDVDFCKRLLERRWKLLFYPQWKVAHRGGISAEVLGYRRFISLYYSNLLKYARKHHPGSAPLIWLAVRLGLFMRRLKGGW
jgi:GT2 family glycosyltransferase